MPEGLHRRHALASFMEDEAADGRREHPGVSLEARPGYGYLNLRGDPDSERFVQAVQKALGQPLPAAANAFTAAAQTIFRLGPDEWLVVAGSGAEQETAARLRENLAGQRHALVDVTGGQIMLRLRGPGARQTLARGCTLDLHPRAFSAGQCAQTIMAKTPVLIALVDDTPTFDIIVRRSCADYAARWLRHSSA